MSDWGAVILSIGAIIFACSIAFTAGMKVGINVGQVRVASGQTVCKLTEQSNKTTSWECK